MATAATQVAVTAAVPSPDAAIAVAPSVADPHTVADHSAAIAAATTLVIATAVVPLEVAHHAAAVPLAVTAAEEATAAEDTAAVVVVPSVVADKSKNNFSDLFNRNAKVLQS